MVRGVSGGGSSVSLATASWAQRPARGRSMQRAPAPRALPARCALRTNLRQLAFLPADRPRRTLPSPPSAAEEQMRAYSTPGPGGGPAPSAGCRGNRAQSWSGRARMQEAHGRPPGVPRLQASSSGRRAGLPGGPAGGTTKRCGANGGGRRPAPLKRGAGRRGPEPLQPKCRVAGAGECVAGPVPAGPCGRAATGGRGARRGGALRGWPTKP
jgi:hypothetical protein